MSSRTLFTAGGHSFHIAFISFFRNYVKLFLNSFGIQMSTAVSISIFIFGVY